MTKPLDLKKLRLEIELEHAKAIRYLIAGSLFLVGVAIGKLL